MNNVLDYLYWRGDLSFEQDALNEVDALIFSEFSYIDFNLLAPKELAAGKLTIRKAANLWKKADRKVFMPTGYLHHENAYEALTLAGDSVRFKNILIAEDIKRLSLEDETKFGVTSFHRKNEPFFIAFEGTDLRSISWKEDMQMGYLPVVPSQKSAVEYLETHFEKYPQLISLGGHSKGGNLATYAAISIKEEYLTYIDKIYGFDGPGFLKSTLVNKQYQKIEPKLMSFIPQDSLVGLLMYKLEEQIVIYSHATDSRQHDLFTWEVIGNRFVPSELTENAKQIQQLADELMGELSLDDREHFSEALFSVIGDSENDYVMGDRQFHLEKIPKVIVEFKNLSPKSRKILVKVLRLFYRKRIELV